MKNHPTFVMALYNSGIIKAPIVAIDIASDNQKYQSTITIGSYSEDKLITKNNIFNRTLPLVQKYYLDSSTFIYRPGTKLKGYRWSILFEPDAAFLNRYAYFEMDMDYISVPLPVFERGIKTTFSQIFESRLVEC